MLSPANGHTKSNGRVSPMDEATVKKLSMEDIEDTPVMVAGDPLEPAPEVVKKNLIYRLFKKKDASEKKVEEEEKTKKPDVPKLKTFGIVGVYIPINYFILMGFFV